MSEHEEKTVKIPLVTFKELQDEGIKKKVDAGSDLIMEMSDAELNEKSLQPLFRTTKAWFIFTLSLAMFVAWAVACWGYQIWTGMGVTNLNHPVFWGMYIATFVFWVGVSHSGTMVSSILRLVGATWRRPILRGAEAMTTFSLLVAGMFPLIHVGRIWRIYYMFPLPNQRELWPNLRSPLAWDMTAITVYLTASSIFLLVGLLPDIALARDLCPKDNWRRLYLRVCALGWRGTHRQWMVYERVSIYLAIFVLLIAPSVHTIVSWDFAMSITPVWHTTIFGPYFVVGAIYSGVAGVITLMILLRWVFKLDDIIKLIHLTNLSKMLLLMSIIWTYFYFTDYLVTWYGNNPVEMAVWDWQGSRFGVHLFIMLGCSVVTIGGLSWHAVRTSPGALLFITIWVNIAMYLERYLIVVPILSHRDNPFTWTDYTPSFVETSIAVGAAAYFFMLYAVFIKLMPIVTIADVKEGKVITGDVNIGNRNVRAYGKPELHI